MPTGRKKVPAMVGCDCSTDASREAVAILEPWATDRWPQTFRYISDRLCRQVVDQDDAATWRSPLGVKLNLGFVSVDLSRSRLNRENRFALARAATAAVVDNTGTLEQPGEYVRAVVNLRCTYFPVHMGWLEHPNQEIAGFFTDEVLPDLGRVFVALIGSVQNYEGHRPEAVQEGWTPSDLFGLYNVLNSTLEPRDGSLTPEHLEDDARMEPLVRAEVAERIGSHLMKDFPASPMDFLAWKHYAFFDVELQHEHFDIVLIGAPLWVATPLPAPRPR